MLKSWCTSGASSASVMLNWPGASNVKRGVHPNREVKFMALDSAETK